MQADEFIFPARVYYEDTDLAGVVYYANYLKFYERGRTEWLRSLNQDQSLLIEQGIAFAVRRAEVDYLASARFNDHLAIFTKVVEVKRASIWFEQKITLHDDHSKVLSRGKIHVACVNVTTMKPKAIPLELMEVIRSGS